jgi:hypothetical protein
MLRVVFSPYELHARSVCASASLLLGEPAVTLLPAPLEGTDAGSVGRAVLDSPGFGRLMERWRWSSPLWRSGALCGGVAGRLPLSHVQRAAAGIVAAGEGAGVGSLAGLVRETRFEETAAYLEAVSRDLERGGGDPSVSVPVSVGLEAYAGEVGGVMAVGAGRSLVGRLEAHRERVVCRFRTALVHGASGALLGELREALADELSVLRDAVGRVLAGDGDAIGDVDAAGGALEEAVSGVPDGWLGPREEDELRVRGGVRRVGVVVSLSLVPSGDALRAAARAAELLASGRGVRGGPRRAPGDGVSSESAGGSGGGTALAAGTVMRMRVREVPMGL